MNVLIFLASTNDSNGGYIDGLVVFGVLIGLVVFGGWLERALRSSRKSKPDRRYFTDTVDNYLKKHITDVGKRRNAKLILYTIFWFFAVLLVVPAITVLIFTVYSRVVRK